MLFKFAIKARKALNGVHIGIIELNVQLLNVHIIIINRINKKNRHNHQVIHSARHKLLKNRKYHSKYYSTVSSIPDYKKHTLLLADIFKVLPELYTERNYLFVPKKSTIIENRKWY